MLTVFSQPTAHRMSWAPKLPPLHSPPFLSTQGEILGWPLERVSGQKSTNIYSGAPWICKQAFAAEVQVAPLGSAFNALPLPMPRLHLLGTAGMKMMVKFR